MAAHATCQQAKRGLIRCLWPAGEGLSVGA